MKVHVTIVSLFFTGFLFSQDIQEKIIEGYIRNNKNLSIEGIHVINNSNGEATITNSDGRFGIKASLNDEIVISGIQFARKKIIVNEELYNSILLNIFLDEFVNEYKGKDPTEDIRYHNIQKRYMKRHNKLIEDAHEVELRHLHGLVDELVKEFIITKEEVREIMEEFGDTTEKLYIHVMENYGLRKPNKKKVMELMRYKHGL